MPHELFTQNTYLSSAQLLGYICCNISLSAILLTSCRCNKQYQLQALSGSFLLLPVAADQGNFGGIAELVSWWTKFARVIFADGEVATGTSIHTHRSKTGLQLTLEEAWTKTLIKQEAKVLVDVQFHLDKGYFERLHKAVEDLGIGAIRKVFPAMLWLEPSKRNVTQHSKIPKELRIDNEVQSFALEKVLKCSPTAPFVLTGPFGTGKTRLIARAAYQIAISLGNSARVLICVHHKVTADCYIEDYFGPLHSSLKVKAVRFIPGRAHVPEGTKFAQQYIDTQTMRHKKETYNVIVCTNIAVSSLFNELRCGPGFFTHIFLDEAAQAFEPEAMIPLLFANESTAVVLAGDHLQVHTYE